MNTHPSSQTCIADVEEAAEVRTVFVVDDTSDCREPLARLLRVVGHNPISISSGAEALAHLSKQRPDVILLDLKMPVFDGHRLTAYWQLTEPDILRRVIVLSGYSRLTVDQEPPTFARLAKPFDFPTLMKVVHECMADFGNLTSFGGIHV